MVLDNQFSCRFLLHHLALVSLDQLTVLPILTWSRAFDLQ